MSCELDFKVVSIFCKYFFDKTKFFVVKAIILGKFYIRFKPIFSFFFCFDYVDVYSCFLG